jgi:uncharacterized membrane protein YedE/YeeE
MQRVAWVEVMLVVVVVVVVVVVLVVAVVVVVVLVVVVVVAVVVVVVLNVCVTVGRRQDKILSTYPAKKLYLLWYCLLLEGWTMYDNVLM